METQIFVLRTTANREDQVVDFIGSNVQKKKLEVFAIIRAHGMRGYIFIEAKDRQAAEESYIGIPYAKGLLPKPVEYKKIQVNIQKNDIVEIITGPFKREKAKVVRIDTQKEEVVLELLETAIPIPLTLKLDSVKVIRRENATEEELTSSQ